MIISLGIDIVEIEEIKKSIEKSKRFIERVYTTQEISYCENKLNKYASYAARFAAKEAVMKALGTGWDYGVQWKQIEVINSKLSSVNEKKSVPNAQYNLFNKKPEIKLSGKALKLSKEMGVKNILLSLSHSKHFAIACITYEDQIVTQPNYEFEK